MQKDVTVLADTRDALHRQMNRYFAGEADAESAAKVAYLGFATAYVVATKHEITRLAA
jgi:hypothetical protein